MKSFKKLFFVFSIFALFSHANAEAKTTINWWHAFGGRLGELLDVQVKDFNASQDKYEVVHTRKGNYSETLNAGIAAFRAKQQPHILMVFEVGTASMMAAKGATKPIYEVMNESGLKFNQNAFIPPVKGYYTTTDGQKKKIAEIISCGATNKRGSHQPLKIMLFFIERLLGRKSPAIIN